MSFQTSEPLMPEDSHISPARRRRKRRMLLDGAEGEQAEYLEDLARHTTPSVDFFVFSLLSGLLLALALYTGHQVLFLLALVVLPFMAPIVGLSLSAVVGSPRFLLLNLGGLLQGALLMFGGSLLGGWIFSFLGEVHLAAAIYPQRFSLIHLLVLTLAAGISAYGLARSPQRRPSFMAVLLAYEIFIPLGLAGFAISAPIPGLASYGLSMFCAHLLWAVLTGAIFLLAYGIKPRGVLPYVLGAFLAAISLLIVLSHLNVTAAALSQPEMTETPLGVSVPSQKATSVFTDTPTPTATVTSTATPRPSSTITPTLTSTITPTLVYALVSAKEGHGAIIRAEADIDSKMVATPLNDTLVEVFEEKIMDDTIWAHVRLIQDGKEVVGWIMRGLITTATPAGPIAP